MLELRFRSLDVREERREGVLWRVGVLVDCMDCMEGDGGVLEDGCAGGLGMVFIGCGVEGEVSEDMGEGVVFRRLEGRADIHFGSGRGCGEGFGWGFVGELWMCGRGGEGGIVGEGDGEARYSRSEAQCLHIGGCVSVMPLGLLVHGGGGSGTCVCLYVNACCCLPFLFVDIFLISFPAQLYLLRALTTQPLRFSLYEGKGFRRTRQNKHPRHPQCHQHHPYPTFSSPLPTTTPQLQQIDKS